MGVYVLRVSTEEIGLHFWEWALKRFKYFSQSLHLWYGQHLCWTSSWDVETRHIHTRDELGYGRGPGEVKAGMSRDCAGPRTGSEWSQHCTLGNEAKGHIAAQWEEDGGRGNQLITWHSVFCASFIPITVRLSRFLFVCLYNYNPFWFNITF